MLMVLYLGTLFSKQSTAFYNNYRFINRTSNVVSSITLIFIELTMALIAMNMYLGQLLWNSYVAIFEGFA